MHHHEIPRPEHEIPISLREYDRPRILTPDGNTTKRSKRPVKEGKLNVAYITSIRDTGGEDRNGSIVSIQGRQRYMMGLIEAVNQAINENKEGWDLGNFIRIRGIITDDLKKDDMGGYPRIPTQNEPWIHPLDARNDEGRLLTDITAHIPSRFRKIPSANKTERAEAHRQWEEEVYKISQEMGADIIISDHLMVKIISLIEDTRYGLGRVLNIHPGIMDLKNQSRLPGSTPTKDAIDRANSGYVYDKQSRLYLRATNNVLTTGASLHFIDELFDHGPVVADSAVTRVYKFDTEQELRFRNYPVKIAVFIRGMMHYV